MSSDSSISEQLMLAFYGATIPDNIKEWVAQEPLGGFTLFRNNSGENALHFYEITSELQQIAKENGNPPLLFGIDQEGGQFLALGDGATQFAGNMAISATRDPNLAWRVGEAMGKELAALGIQINYAPMCDINTNADNPAGGIRTFGDNPELAGDMVEAFIAGMQSVGVAATLKHFPGIGDAAVDSHHELPVIEHSRERLEQIELFPFERGIYADAKLLMSGHFAIPSVTGREDLPATLCHEVLQEMVRDEMGFNGVLITDALDMKAIAQGQGQVIDVIASLRAGVDLLLLTIDQQVNLDVSNGIKQAVNRRILRSEQVELSNKRIRELKEWTSQMPQPSLDILRCEEHLNLSLELAQRAVTLIKDDANILPLRADAYQKILVVNPESINLTPADTSDCVSPSHLVDVMGQYHNHVDEILTSHHPEEDEISSAVAQLNEGGYDLLILGTLSASMNDEQTALANALLQQGVPTVTIAMRTPYDIAAYPTAQTNICSYGNLRVNLQATVNAMFGKAPITGQLPVTIEGHYSFGHGLQVEATA